MPISITSQRASSTRSPTSRPQHVSLAKRILFPNLASDDLPPLLNSPVPPELNAELYEFIALALRAFVNPWWTKITRYDKEFLPEITRIVTHVVQRLETQTLAVDFADLLCNDIPLIVIQHYRDYRSANSKMATSYAAGGALSLSQLFHQLQPHIAVSSDGQLDEVYFRQVVDHILHASLPSVDSAAEPERTIVREIILKIVMTDIIPKITQPWFIEKTIVDLLGPQPSVAQSTKPPSPSSSNPFSFHSLIILFLSAVQTISGACLSMIQAYKQAVHTIKLVNQSSTPEETSPKPDDIAFPTIVERNTSSNSVTQISPLSLSRAPSASSSVTSSLNAAPSPSSVINSTHTTLGRKAYLQAPLMMVSEIFSMKERYAASIIGNTAQMMASFFMPFLDKFIPFIICRTLSPDLVLNIVRIAKRNLFPTGYPGVTPPDPTPQEQAATHAKLLAWRGKGSASHALPVLLGPDTSSTLQVAIEPLSNQACNVHLVVILLDRIVMALYPELAGTPSS